MATTPTPTVYSYTELNPGKYATVKHYELQKENTGKPILSNLINIGQNRKFARSNPDYWLRIRKGKKWSKPITGLFPTSKEQIYFGDIQYKKHLILVHFQEQENKIEVYIFWNFYTPNLKPVLTSLFPQSIKSQGQRETTVKPR